MYHKGDDALSIQVEVWGPYACFTRPEMKTERVSYDVMTPSAARGILEAIFWHPGLRWHIDCIHVLLPIRFASIRRNEVKSVALATKARTVMQGGEAELAIYTPADIQQRAALVLQEVRYVIEAHFSMTKNAAPAITPANFKTSCGAGWHVASAFIPLTSAAANFPPASANGAAEISPP